MKYLINKNYDTSIRISDNDYKCFSKSYYKKNLEDKYQIVGSLFRKNNKYLIKDEYFYLNDKRYRLYQYKDSLLLTKRVIGYFESDNGLVEVLADNYLLIIILIGLFIIDILLLNHYSGLKRIISADNGLTDNISGSVSNAIGDVKLSLIEDDEVIEETVPDENGKYLFSDVSKGSLYYLLVEDDRHRDIETINYKDVSKTRDIELSEIETYIYINNETDESIYLDNIDSLLSYEDGIDKIVLNINITNYDYVDDDLSDYVYKAYNITADIKKYNDGNLIVEEDINNFNDDVVIYIDNYDYLNKEISIKDIDLDVYLDSESIYNRYLCFNIKHAGNYLISYENEDIYMTGKSSFAYSDRVYLNTENNTLSYTLTQDGESTNRAMVEIYVKDDNEELVLLSRSEIRQIGKEEDNLVSGVKLTTGIYSGVMKIIYVDDNDLKIGDVDIDVYIIVNN